MSWEEHVGVLRSGQTVSFRPRGNSMAPRILSGQQVTLEPVSGASLLVPKDIVLCRVKGELYLHLIRAIQGDRFQIGNMRGHINGWTTRDKIYGRVVQVDP